MTGSIRERLHAELLRIARQLGEQAMVTPEGIGWKTLKANNFSAPTMEERHCLYSGSAGIVLFFAALYKYTDDDQYKEVAESGADRLIIRLRQSEDYRLAFYTGSMGTAYCLIKVYEISGREKYRDEALRIALHCLDHISDQRIACEILTGAAGVLLALLHLHSHTSDQRLYVHIDRLAGYLPNSAWHGRKGIYWDRSHHNIRGLCGFSHGVSGIAFALLETGYYVHNPALYELAVQGLVYEASHYLEKLNNWPDFRTSISADETFRRLRESLRSGDLTVFYTAGNLNAWCHGAAGIGLTRLRAYELLAGQDIYMREAQRAIRKTIETDIEMENPFLSYTLCHGTGGNMELLTEAYRITGNEPYLNTALQAGVRALQHYEQLGYYRCGSPHYPEIEDLSLFTGVAGVGYFYLRLLDPVHTESVLLPRLHKPAKNIPDKSSYPYLSITPSSLRYTVLEKAYPQTLSALSATSPQKLRDWLSRDPEDTCLKERFEQWMKQVLAEKTAADDSVEIFCRLEAEKNQMDHVYGNHMLMYVKGTVCMEKAEKMNKLSDRQLQALALQVHPDIRLRTIIDLGSNSNVYYLLIPTFQGVKELSVQVSVYHLLEMFVQPQPISDILMLADTDEQAQLLMIQLRHFIQAGILTEPDTVSELSQTYQTNSAGI